MPKETVADKSNNESAILTKLENPKFYFLDSVYIVEKSATYRLVVIHDNRVLTDCSYKTLTGAKIAFSSRYRKHCIIKGFRPLWTDTHNHIALWRSHNKKVLGPGQGESRPQLISDRIAEYICGLDNINLGKTNVELIANRFEKNRYHLSRQFKREKKMNLNDFINNERMIRAAEILRYYRDERVNIEALSKQLGFKNPYYFVTLFKNYFKLHPLRYKEIKKGLPLKPPLGNPAQKQ